MQNCPIPYTFNLMTFLLSGHYDEQAKHQTANRVSLPFPHSHLLGWPLRLCGSFISRLFCPHRQKETDPFAHSDFIGGPAPARQTVRQAGFNIMSGQYQIETPPPPHFHHISEIS